MLSTRKVSQAVGHRKHINSAGVGLHLSRESNWKKTPEELLHIR